MNSLELNNLVKYKIIDDYFDYQDLDEGIVAKYKYFEQQFDELFIDKAKQFKLTDCYFYIKNRSYCNAFAKSKKGYNIIGITSGYIIKMLDIFSEKYFSSIILIGLKNEISISNAYADLHDLEKFKFNKFMLECSIQFTFGHEFQHILQFNSSKIATDYYRNENLDGSDFDIKAHAWEFDADRSASFEVLKYIFKIKNEYKVKNDQMFLCMLYLGLSSIFITKVFFYLKIENSIENLSKIEFYTKKYSHPHPIIRLFNIIDYFYDNVKDVFPNLIVDKQVLFNNVLGIVKLYFSSYLPKHNVIDEIFKDLDLHLDTINSYNDELFDTAINDQSIRNLLTIRGINYK